MSDQHNRATALSEVLTKLVNDYAKVRYRMVGLEMTLKGMALLYILDGDGLEAREERAKSLIDILNQMSEAVIADSDLDSGAQDSLFSSPKGIISAAEDVISKLKKESENKHE